jgi:hypothetical protein
LDETQASYMRTANRIAPNVCRTGRSFYPDRLLWSSCHTGAEVVVGLHWFASKEEYRKSPAKHAEGMGHQLSERNRGKLHKGAGTCAWNHNISVLG